MEESKVILKDKPVSDKEKSTDPEKGEETMEKTKNGLNKEKEAVTESVIN